MVSPLSRLSVMKQPFFLQTSTTSPSIFPVKVSDFFKIVFQFVYGDCIFGINFFAILYTRFCRFYFFVVPGSVEAKPTHRTRVRLFFSSSLLFSYLFSQKYKFSARIKFHDGRRFAVTFLILLVFDDIVNALFYSVINVRKTFRRRFATQVG